MTGASYFCTPPLGAHTYIHIAPPAMPPPPYQTYRGYLCRREGQDTPRGGCVYTRVCVCVVLNGAWSAPICLGITVSPSFRGTPGSCLGDVFITL